VDEDLERELRASDLALLAPSRGCPPRRFRPSVRLVLLGSYIRFDYSAHRRVCKLRHLLTGS
jgi:hypothetical protein